MGELLLEMLFVVGELFFDVLFEVAGEALLDLVLRAIAKVFGRVPFANPVVASAGFMVLGALAGGLSLVVFPHPIVPPTRLHGISVLISPIITGLVMSLIGSGLSRRGKKTTQIESFGYGFAFAFGMALTRYFFLL